MVAALGAVNMTLRTLLIDNYDSYTYNLFQLLADVTGVEPLVFKNDAIGLKDIQELLQGGRVQNIVISPGPGSSENPADIGVCMEVLRQLGSVPVLGVCLGHQALATAAGGRVVRAPEPVHGRISELHHTGHALLESIPSGGGQGFEVVRYHSLVVEACTLPVCLQPIAWTHGTHHAVASAKPCQPTAECQTHATAEASSNGWQNPKAGAMHEQLGQGMVAMPKTNVQQAGPSQEPLIMALAHKNQPHYGVQFHPESICTRYGMQLLLNFHRLSCLHLHLQRGLPRSVQLVNCAPGRMHDPHPWPNPRSCPGAQPLGLRWRKCVAAVKPQDASQGLRLFEALFAWKPHTFWLDSIYDAHTFVTALAAVGVDVLTDEEVEGIVKTEVSLNSLEDPLIDLHTKYGSISNLHISCPLFKLKRNAFRESTVAIAWRTLEAIVPNKVNSKIVASYASKLKALTHSKQFNMLHLRMESDWVEHCKQVKKAKESSNDNCMAHTDDVDKILLAYNLPISTPLLVSTMWDLTDPARAEAVLARLRKAGYTVLTSREYASFYTADREFNALLDYQLALQADRFVGNSVSTFSAMAILQRRQAGHWAAYYNMGAMPIEAHIPARLLPWVFAYNSATPEDDYMVQVAVKSAMPYMSILPICLWSGDVTAPIYTWLKEKGVMMISHNITWGDELWVLAEPHAAHNARISPLYRSQLELTSDFARVDVAILPQLEQYNYILLTSPYVLFIKEVSLNSLSTMLPSVISMHSAPSDDDTVPVSDVLLLNLLELRSSYEEFKQFVLNSRHGAMFPDYGPGASGAFAQFYEPYLRMVKVASRLAINAGTNYDTRSKILNFEGPKVHDFLHYYRTGSCNWGNACELGLRKSLCPTIKHWQSFLNSTQDQLGVAMWYACETLYAPHLFWPKFQAT